MDGSGYLVLLIILSFVLWVWAIMDITASRFKNIRYSGIWLLIVIFFPVGGSILYLFLRSNLKRQGQRRFQPNFRKRE